MGKFGDARGGWKKVACWSTKAAISLKRVKIEEKLLWREPIGSHKRSFERYRPRSPTASPSSRLGFATPFQNCNHYYLRTSSSYTDCKFGRYIHRVRQSPEHKPIKNLGEKGARAYPRTAQFFQYPYYLRNE